MCVILDGSAIEPGCEKLDWNLLEVDKIVVMSGKSLDETVVVYIRISLCRLDKVLKKVACQCCAF